ncbi:TGF-beta-activated kinase 1 and MAP3K7-binding 3 isoform X1 [Pelobates cultripes]|uniref:TGF-beta-activated kinase 1 and MAP3K7-binding 3 isoform X1 n=1 Tax=Pelobates cultripes TaxID=61616 RepID=A0AAD1VKS3_PELCU|nr:TGF-beta-activated kinase 1 and MAP3K7-binding 3 isoform X1 [Pelobates cultripes]
MAQSSPQLDIQVLNDLQQRFPEIPRDVVSQCMLQNNSNIDACCRVLKQESSKYLYMECQNLDEARVNSNLLHINLGIHPSQNFHAGDGKQVNGRPLVHSSSDGHIDPQCTSGKLFCLHQEPHSAPAIVAQNYNPFFLQDQSRNSPTPPPQSLQQPGGNAPAMQTPLPTYMHLPRYSTNPITVTVSQNIPSGHNVPRALQIIPQVQNNIYGTPNSIYIRQQSQNSPGRQTQPNSPWPSSPQVSHSHYNPCPLPVYPPSYQPSQYSSKQTQMSQSTYCSPPTSQCTSPFNSPQHHMQPNQLSHQSSHVFVPPSPSTVSPLPYQPPPAYSSKQSSHSVSYLPYGSGINKGSMNKIEITVESPQRPGTAMNRSPSPINNQSAQRSPHPAYAPNTRSSSPSGGMSGQPKSPYGVNPLYITYSQPPATSGSPSPSPHVLMSPSNPTVFKIKVGRAPTENLLNIVDQEQHPGAPEPIQPISLITTAGVEKGVHKYHRSSSSGSDDYAYTQALLLHQRARMERLAKELKMEKEELETLKAEVNGMEYDLMQRRLRRVSCTTAIPTPEEMTRLRGLNRQLQINVDCTLKEVDLLQSRGMGKLDVKAMSNFYENIAPGPAVPSNTCKNEASDSSSERVARRISVTSKVKADLPDSQTAVSMEIVRQKPSPRPARDEDFEGSPWNCNSCTFLNHPALNRCEQCEMPRFT